MPHSRGPRQPISPHPNGKPTFAMNPVEDLPVEELSSWDDQNIATEYIAEPVYSSQALYGISQPDDPHGPEKQSPNK